MKNKMNIRKDFIKNFRKILEGKNINELEQWFTCDYQFDNIIYTWKSDLLKKTFRLEEYEKKAKFKFGFDIMKSGINFEYEDLFVVLKNTNKHVNLVFEIYKLWFIDNKSKNDMKNILQDYYIRLNKK